MRKFMALLVGAFLFLGIASAANATVVITEDDGGVIDTYINHYELIRASGDYIRVDGECYSACTLMLGIIPDSHVCVTPKAIFGFHSATAVYMDGHKEFSPDGTQRLWQAYPARVRHILKAHGWNGKTSHPNLIMVKGSALYRPCSHLAAKLDVPFPIKVGWTFHFPTPADPNAPIVQPDPPVLPACVSRPLPLHTLPKAHPKHTAPKKHQERLPNTTVKPVFIPAVPTLPQVELPKVVPVPTVSSTLEHYLTFIIPEAAYVVIGIITIILIASLAGFLYAAWKGRNSK